MLGILIGLAIYHNSFLDLKMPSAFYKILLDKEDEIDLEDLRNWDPETANSLQFLLDYKEEEQGMPMEEMLGRTFTVTVQKNG